MSEAMKRFFWLTIIPLLVVLPCAAQIPVTSSIAYDPANPTNQILLTWESIPGKQYNVLTTTALGQQPWQVLNSAPLFASNNLVKFRQPIDQTARFYKVVKLDTDPPEVWRLSPSDAAIAVGRQSSLKIYLRDETGIDPTSIALTVGINSSVTLADARLVYTNDVVTYTPGTNEFLGSATQTIAASLAVADTLGHRGTNAWSFQLELPTVLSTNVVLIGRAAGGAAPASATSGLTLVSTNGTTFVFSYTGSSASLTNGQILVSTDANSPYKRKVTSLTDDPVNHTIKRGDEAGFTRRMYPAR